MVHQWSTNGPKMVHRWSTNGPLTVHQRSTKSSKTMEKSRMGDTKCSHENKPKPAHTLGLGPGPGLWPLRVFHPGIYACQYLRVTRPGIHTSPYIRVGRRPKALAPCGSFHTQMYACPFWGCLVVWGGWSVGFSHGWS